jgi:hypothetical protein
MGNMSLLMFIIIVAYLLVSFIRSRKPVGSPAPAAQAPQPAAQKDIAALEVAAVAAAIAAVMGDAPYLLKRVYAAPAVDEKKSTWRMAARSESMMRKVFFK